MSVNKTKVNDYYWPDTDRECRAVVFDTVTDMEPALKQCKQFKVAVQAGGNCGVWPTWLAARFDKVYTFEPCRDNFACLVENVPANVVCCNAALGDTIQKIGLVRNMRNIGAHYVEPGDSLQMVTLDSRLYDLDALDYLCLDIEGYELLALKGAEHLIQKFCPVIQVEDKGLSAKYGVAKGDIERWLIKRYGYQVIARPHRDVILAPKRGL